MVIFQSSAHVLQQQDLFRTVMPPDHFKTPSSTIYFTFSMGASA